MTAILLLQIAAKATLVLLGGFALTRVMTRASAASRHLVWVLALSAALAVPLMHAAGPAWTLAVLPQSTTTLALDPDAVTPTGPSTRPSDARSLAAPMTIDAPIAAASASLTTAPTTPAAPMQSTPLSWGQLLVQMWLVGMTLMLLRLVIGITWAAITVRTASELPETGWLDSLDEALATLGVTRRVGLKVSSRATVPMATGLVRAVVLLPPSAIEWGEERRRVVLQHELAHVKRHDCLMQALAQFVCAVHWFNPAAHIAVARLRAEQERACDDMVIQVGTDARSYADHLFEIALSFRTASFPTWVAMSMAKPSQLEGRVLAILDDARTRCAPSASMRASLVAAMVVVAVPFGALRLSAQVSPSPDVLADVVVARDPAPAIGVVMHRHVDADAVAAVRDERFANVAIVRADMADVDLIEPHPVEVFIEALEARNRMAGPAAEKAFKDATSHIKWTTIEGLGMKGIPATVAAAMQGQPASAVSDETRRRVADALISALNDENPQVRQEALTSLASMRDERAIPGLVRALNDPTTEVRMRALSALSQFNTTAAADGVLTALKDRTPQVREMAARQLANLMSRGQLRDQKYADALSGLLKDDNAAVRANAARALGQLGNTDAVTALTPLLRDADKNVREQAADALGDLADPRAIDALTAALKDTEPEVREQAARALGRIARGQRRTARPSPVPVPPLPPRVSLDQDRIREIEERAREAAERARDAAFRLRDFDFNFDFDLFNRFDAPVPPVPPAAPAAPAAPAPPAPPR